MLMRALNSILFLIANLLCLSAVSAKPAQQDFQKLICSGQGATFELLLDAKRSDDCNPSENSKRQHRFNRYLNQTNMEYQGCRTAAANNKQYSMVYGFKNKNSSEIFNIYFGINEKKQSIKIQRHQAKYVNLCSDTEIQKITQKYFGAYHLLSVEDLKSKHIFFLGKKQIKEALNSVFESVNHPITRNLNYSQAYESLFRNDILASSQKQLVETATSLLATSDQCEIKDNKIVSDKNTKKSGFISNLVFWRNISSCDYLNRIYWMACYSSYLHQEKVVSDDQIMSCQKAIDLSKSLLEKYPSSRNSLLDYQTILTHAKILKYNAELRKIIKSEKLDILEKRRQFEILTESFPRTKDLQIKENQFDAGMIFVLGLIQRLDFELNKEGKLFLLKRALQGIEEIFEISQGFDRARRIMISDTFDHYKALLVIENIILDLGSDLDPNSSRFYDELMTRLQRMKDRQHQDFLREIEELKYSSLGDSLSLADIKIDTGLSEKFKSEEDVVDPVTGAIINLKQQIQSIISESQKEYTTNPMDFGTWKKSARAHLRVAYLSKKLLPMVDEMTMSEITDASETLKTFGEQAWLHYFKTNKKEEAFKVNSMSSDPDADLFLIPTATDFYHLSVAERKEYIIRLVYARNTLIAAQNLPFFDQQMDAEFKAFYSLPLSSEFVRKNYSKARSLDDIYKLWLLSKISQYEIYKINEYKVKTGKYFSLIAENYEKIHKRLVLKRPNLKISDLESLIVPLETQLNDNLKNHKKFIQANQFLYFTAIDPADKFISLEISLGTEMSTLDGYKDPLETQVLKTELKGQIDQSFYAFMQERINSLGYSELKVDYILPLLKNSGTRLDDLLKVFLQDKLKATVLAYVQDTAKDKFFEKNWGKVFEQIFATKVMPQMNDYSIASLRAGLSNFENNKLKDLKKFLLDMNCTKDWEQYQFKFNAENLLWAEFLFKETKISIENYKMRIENNLTLKIKPNFSELSFSTSLETILKSVNFGELESKFVFPRLKSSKADLDQLLAEYRKLKKSDDYGTASDKPKAETNADVPQTKKGKENGSSKPSDDESGSPKGSFLGFLSGLFDGWGSGLGSGSGSGSGSDSDSVEDRGLYVFYNGFPKKPYFAQKRYLRMDGKYSVEIEKFLNTETRVAPGGGVQIYVTYTKEAAAVLTNFLIPSGKGEGTASDFLGSATLGKHINKIDLRKSTVKVPMIPNLLHYTISDFSTKENENAFVHIPPEEDQNYRDYYLLRDVDLKLDPALVFYLKRTLQYHKEEIRLAKAYMSLIDPKDSAERQKLTDVLEDRANNTKKWEAFQKLVLNFLKFKKIHVQKLSSGNLESVVRAMEEKYQFSDKPDVEMPPSAYLAHRIDLNRVSKYVQDYFVEAYRYVKRGTKDNPISYSAISRHPDYGTTIQKNIDEQSGNCAESNALYATILRKYFKIPARNVIGFVGERRDNMNYKYSKKQPASANVISLMEDGHAWSEVLIDDVWKRFDATPYDEQVEKSLAASREMKKVEKPKSAEGGGKVGAKEAKFLSTESGTVPLFC